MPMLDITVELRIFELRRLDGDARHARRMRWILEAEDAGVFTEGLLVGARARPGEAATAFNALARAIAALAYMPHGVTLFGRHWEVKPDEATS